SWRPGRSSRPAAPRRSEDSLRSCWRQSVISLAVPNIARRNRISPSLASAPHSCLSTSQHRGTRLRRHHARAHHNPARSFPQSRPNRRFDWLRDANQKSSTHERMGMTDLELRLAQEREEIAARIASFRETQQRFEREREEFFVKTWQRV